MIFRFLIFLMLFYLVFSLVRRMFPRPVNGMASNGKEANDRRRDGEVSIKYNPHDRNSKSNKVGEYVDYEEVE